MAAVNPRHAVIREGDLHSLSDDDYFDAIAVMPKVLDADGNEVTGIFDDVVDAREQKSQR